MADEQIRFQDGGGYEIMMGVWSRLVGEVFLDWLDAEPGGRWLDVGCGSGAFTEFIADRCAPRSVEAIDPSEAQLAFARQRHSRGIARFWQADAMALPFPDGDFDAATSALVIFFVPEPAKAVGEMARVVRPGGTVSSYVWDILGGGFPYAPVEAEMRALGAAPMHPPRVEAAELDALTALWRGAGLRDVAVRAISVERSFPSFENYWTIALTVPGIGPVVARMPEADRQALQARVAAKTLLAPDGSLTLTARAHAVKGIVPPAA